MNSYLSYFEFDLLIHINPHLFDVIIIRIRIEDGIHVIPGHENCRCPTARPVGITTNRKPDNICEMRYDFQQSEVER